MKTKWTRRGLARGIGAVVIVTLMAFAGLAPVGALDDLCPRGGFTILHRSGCGSGAAEGTQRAFGPQELRSSRYSSTAGEIMWQRSTGAIGYEIVRDGTSLGVQDVLSWYMTDLDESRTYAFEVRAVYPDGFMSDKSTISIPGW